MIQAKMESDFIDTAPDFASAHQRFLRFRSTAVRMVRAGVVPGVLDRDPEIFIISPEQTLPVTIRLRFFLTGESWASITKSADAFIEAVAHEAGITVRDEEFSPDKEPADAVYEFGDLELVGG